MTKKGAMTVAEAGRKGGAATAERHGHEFYEKLGKMGGAATAEKHGHEFYKEIGRKGGASVRRLLEAGRKALGE